MKRILKVGVAMLLSAGAMSGVAHGSLPWTVQWHCQRCARNANCFIPPGLPGHDFRSCIQCVQDYCGLQCTTGPTGDCVCRNNCRTDDGIPGTH